MCWNEFEKYVVNRANNIYKIINKIHDKNILKLKSKLSSKTNSEIEIIDNFVHNKSSAVFTEKELHLLNRGLKFAPTPSRAPLEEIVTDLESGISKLNTQQKQAIRFHTQKIILQDNLTTQSFLTKNKNNNSLKCTRLLKSKDVIYIKADKGNSLVILDRTDYDEQVTKMIEEGPYEKEEYKNGNIKNPLPKMIKSVKDVAMTLERVLEIPNFHFKMNMPNPKIPYLYALPKIHKNGNKMRPIVSNINTPTEKLASWLISELNNMAPPIGMFVKNSYEFVNKIKETTIREDEIMVSFDVTALYPNVPVDIAIKCLIDHAKGEKVSDEKILLYQKVAEICMDQSYFQFRGKIYKQTFGTCMGSKLAPYLSNIFMCHLENTISTSNWFPRVWLRYVDDVFAIIKKDSLAETLTMLNNQYQSIKFTYEEEVDGSLPFLDIKVTRIGKKFQFGIYRKPTNTKRLITSDSHHNGAHKKAAFHSLAHRLYTIPLSKLEFEKELKYIKDTARINGYNNHFIQTILEKHRKKLQITSHTTLADIAEPKVKKRISVPFYPSITNKIRNLLNKFDVELVTKSKNLATQICKYKDAIPPLSKSGIYQIACSKCEDKYIGQTARAFEKRLQEHTLAVRNNDIHKSSVAEHTNNNKGHEIDHLNSKIIMAVRDNWKLDACESLFINKHRDHLMNQEASPIISNLFQLVNCIH